MGSNLTAARVLVPVGHAKTEALSVLVSPVVKPQK